jgi:Domain of unknown function (DUF4157)
MKTAASRSMCEHSAGEWRPRLFRVRCDLRTVVLTFFLILSALSTVTAAGLGGVPEPLIGPAPANTLGGALAKLRGGVLALGMLGADVWRTTKAASAERAVEAGAPIVEKWILSWRDQALEDGTQPMRSTIKEQLIGYFPEELLDRVRYRIGWGEGRPMQSSLFRLLGARALSLLDVIVFRDADIAANPVIWAHELAHVQQYDRWGTVEFAKRYVRDHHTVELEAWEVSARYTIWALEEGKLASAAAVPGTRSAIAN